MNDKAKDCVKEIEKMMNNFSLNDDKMTDPVADKMKIFHGQLQMIKDQLNEMASKVEKLVFMKDEIDNDEQKEMIDLDLRNVIDEIEKQGDVLVTLLDDVKELDDLMSRTKDS